MSNMPLQRETYFNRFALKTLLPFVAQYPVQYLEGAKGCRIAYRHFLHQPQSAKLITLVNGRAENMLKWTELAYDFYQQGYDVLLLDHRGQGYSQRLVQDTELGYLDDFRYYAEDLAKTQKKVVALFDYPQQYLLAHSMGALISSVYLANYDHQIQRAVFASPFYGVPLKQPVRDQIMINLMLLAGQGKRYVFGKGRYQPVDIAENKLSHSRSRMRWMNRINQGLPQLHLGGPTFRWVHLSIVAIRQLAKIIPQIETPVLLLQAEQDEIVANENLKKLTALFPHCDYQFVPQAKHEILFERDDIRQPVWQQILAYLAE